METGELTVESVEDVNPSSNSVLKNIIDLYFSPGKAFESIRTKPRWFIPFLLCTLFSIAFTVISWDASLDDRIHDIKNSKTMSAEEIDRRVSNLQMQQQGDLTNMHIPSFLIGVGFLTAGQAVNLFGMAFIIWLALHLVANKVGFKSVLSVCSFSLLVKILEYIIKVPVILINNSAKVHIGPAAILPLDWEYSPLYNLFSKIDVFSIWIVILLIMGLAIVLDIPRKKTVITIGYLWGIWLLLAMLLGDFQLIGIG